MRVDIKRDEHSSRMRPRLRTLGEPPLAARPPPPCRGRSMPMLFFKVLTFFPSKIEVS